MVATVQNLVIEQGATFSMNVALNDANNNPLDVTTYTSQGAMRRDYQSQNSYNFTCALSNGNLQLTMTANNSANAVPGRYVYDVVLINSNGIVVRLLEGLVSLKPEVTNWANTVFPVT
jgi:hypothetical protein